MRVVACLLVLLAAPVLLSQDGLSVKVEPVVDGKAEPGKEFTIKLNFVVPEGFHAYHKDNPGYSQPVKVKWKSLAGLELLREDWPEPHKKVDEFGEEWELGPIFDIAYTFKVPADAQSKLTVTGSHETQFCDAEGCYNSEGDFSAEIEVAGSGAPAPQIPEARVSTSFTAPAKPGGEAILKWTFEFTKGYHGYHKDNPGYGMAPNFDWTELSGLTLKEARWPEPKKHEIEPGWIEWEYPDGFSIEFVFSVPADASEELTVRADWNAQVCDEEACFDRKGSTSATLTVASAAPPEDKSATDAHGFYLDFDYALEKARKENKLLLVDFNGEN